MSMLKGMKIPGIGGSAGVASATLPAAAPVADVSKAYYDEKRAQAVKATPVEDYHIKADRLDAKGFGGTKPSFSNDTPESRSSNWRIELVKM